MCEGLKQVRQYEREAEKKIPKENRPVFHFSPPTGWMNDPNGFSRYKGEYHLFFQYHPYKAHWDTMYWGHAKSRDMIQWEYLPAALAPGNSYDSAGIFSGSALEEGENQVLVYTGVEEGLLENGTKRMMQSQCIALGDGRDYTKLLTNPVVRAELLPEGSSREDFRDPKIWKEGNRYYMAVGSRAGDGSGQIALFTASSLEAWEFAGILDRSENQLGKMWECPDFFPLEEKQVLLVSPQEMKARGLEFHNGHNAVFLLGNYEKEQFAFTREKEQNVDYGLDFYAPQTMETEDGRRIMIGWMQSWDNFLYPKELGWSGMTTIPRELSLKGDRVCQQPVRELLAYRKNPVSYRGICPREEGELEGIEGRCIDLELGLQGNEYQSFRLKLAADEEHYTEIIYNRDAQTLAFDRTCCGLTKDVISTRRMQVKNKELCTLRILLDRYSVEIFVNGGEQVMSSLIFTPERARSIRFASEGEVELTVTKYDIALEGPR